MGVKCGMEEGMPNFTLRGGQKRWVFVCLFVTLLKALEYRNNFDAVGYREVCSYAFVFSFLRRLPIGDATKCQSPKNGKNWGFLLTKGNRIHWLRQNLACKRIPWVCYSTPYLAVIGKRGRYRSPPKVQICPKLWFLANGSWHNEHIHMKFGV